MLEKPRHEILAFEAKKLALVTALVDTMPTVGAFLGVLPSQRYKVA